MEELLAQGLAQNEIACGSRVLTIEQLLASPRNRNHTKQRLISAGLKQNRCELRGIATWMGKPLSMCLHHVNHSQTENFSGRNRGRGSPPRAEADRAAA